MSYHDITNCTKNVWVEKYRPTNFNNIILNDMNRKIMENIIHTGHFPNILFYGPPGTGKTTTIINLIKTYQIANNFTETPNLVIHLNASDDRGIDVIRNQINSFVNTKPLFDTGLKFVILDEADYMTKPAQQALKYLTQTVSTNVRFCIICNYISKIDTSLQTEFMCIRFNQLDNCHITTFLNNIILSENINITPDEIVAVQMLYNSDIRSMINFLQSNKNNFNDPVLRKDFFIIDNNTWDMMTAMFVDKSPMSDILKYIDSVNIKYRIDKSTIMTCYLNYIIRHRLVENISGFLNFVENALHSHESNMDIFINYSVTQLMKWVT